jgi:hypothetical protein
VVRGEPSEGTGLAALVAHLQAANDAAGTPSAH